MNRLDAISHEVPVLDALLAPLPQAGGAGMPLRYEPVYQQIQDARKHDDASLPMGDWDRPLQKANWRLAATLCQDALSTQGKDLQVAAWLCEAWTQLKGLDGLIAGVRLLDGLVERYWETAWPRIEDGDEADARCAPFAWLDSALSMTCTLHLALLRLEDREPFDINLYDWERASIARPTDPDPEAGIAEPLPSRDELMQYAAQPANRAMLSALHAGAGVAEGAWRALERRLDTKLGGDLPSLRRTRDALTRLARAASGLLAGHHVGHGAEDASPWTADRAAPALMAQGPGRDPAESAEGGGVSADEGIVVSMGALANRAQAYRQLARIADYLAVIEPHSPTPYLLRKAVAWGGMSLADLMREVAQEEGGITRYLSLLNE